MRGVVRGCQRLSEVVSLRPSLPPGIGDAAGCETPQPLQVRNASAAGCETPRPLQCVRIHQARTHKNECVYAVGHGPPEIYPGISRTLSRTVAVPGVVPEPQKAFGVNLARANRQKCQCIRGAPPVHQNAPSFTHESTHCIWCLCVCVRAHSLGNYTDA